MRILKLLPILLLPLLLTPRPTSAANLSPSAIPQDAAWLIHIDFDTLRASATWFTLKEKFTGPRRAEIDAHIQQLERLTGLKFPDDLHDITLYGSDFTPQNAVLLLHAQLNQTQVTAFLSHNPDYKSTPYHGHDILTWKERVRDRIVYGAFSSDSLAVVAPTEDLVKSALDALDAKSNMDAAKNITSPLLTDYKPKTILFLAATDIAKLRRPNAPNRAQSPLLDQIDSASLSLSESNNALTADLAINTKDPQTADRLDKFIDGLKASNALAMSDPNPSTRAKILDAIFPSLESTANGTTLTIHCSLPIDQLEPTLHLLTPPTHPAPTTTQPASPLLRHKN